MTSATQATMMQPMHSEILQEGATTRRVLERVPQDKLSWRPHPKSMSLGQLAMHTALVPGLIGKMAQIDAFDAANANFDHATPTSVEEVLSTHDASMQAAAAYLGGMSNETAMSTWRFTGNGKDLMVMPRVAMLRALMFNHWYHHRGQLSVYLRLLDVPVPSIYGPSADENPFAEVSSAIRRQSPDAIFLFILRQAAACNETYRYLVVGGDGRGGDGADHGAEDDANSSDGEMQSVGWHGLHG